MSLFSRLAVLPQYLLPKRALTQAAGGLARARGGRATTWAIERFVKRYGVDMAEAASPDCASYATFNDFFTRPLHAGARVPASGAYSDWVSPVDGTISQLGAMTSTRGNADDALAEQIFQAKGHHYSATALLGGDAALVAPFAGGHFATLYLSPRDYHRIHMPCQGTITHMIHVPGRLFSVNPATARGVPGLFARNERVVCLFDTPYGRLALVLVGATIVGSMATVWHGVVNPPRPQYLRQWSYKPPGKTLARGQEMGRFLLGSTVVLLWPADTVAINPGWAPGQSIRMGQPMGQCLRHR